MTKESGCEYCGCFPVGGGGGGGLALEAENPQLRVAKRCTTPSHIRANGLSLNWLA